MQAFEYVALNRGKQRTLRHKGKLNTAELMLVQMSSYRILNLSASKCFAVSPFVLL